MSIEIVERADRLIVSTPYLPEWKDWAREAGGKWDAGSMAWTFRLDQREAVEAAIERIFEENGDE